MIKLFFIIFSPAVGVKRNRVPRLRISRAGLRREVADKLSILRCLIFIRWLGRVRVSLSVKRCFVSINVRRNYEERGDCIISDGSGFSVELR